MSIEIFYIFFTAIAVVIAVSIVVESRYRGVLKEFRSTAVLLEGKLRFREVYSYSLGVLRLRIDLVCSSRGGCSYVVRKSFEELEKGGGLELDMDKLCSLKPPSATVKWGWRRLSQAGIVVPAAVITSPARYRDIAVLCFDRGWLEGLTDIAELKGVYEGSYIDVEARITGGLIVFRSRGGLGLFIKGLEGALSGIEGGVKVRSIGIELQSCVEGVCVERQLLQLKPGPIDHSVRVWDGIGRGVAFINLKRVDVDSLIRELGIKHGEGIIGLCNGIHKLTLKLDIPFRKDIRIETETSVCRTGP